MPLSDLREAKALRASTIFIRGYVATMPAVVGLSRGAAIDYAADGIWANAIASRLIQTPTNERWHNDSHMRERLLAVSPIGRAAKPEDIAALSIFLESD